MLDVSLSSLNRVLGRTCTFTHGESSGFFLYSDGPRDTLEGNRAMQILVCPKCHYLTGNDERYCCKCGTRLVDVGKQAFCGSCGAVLMPYAEYCSQCGTKRDAGEQPGGGPCPRK